MGLNKRLEREDLTMECMLKIYCKDHHKSDDGSLCSDCIELRDYARSRLTKCPYEENKPTCANCTIHCYQKSMRKKVRQVMRYSGPRMIYKHPVLAIFHIFDGWRKPIDIGAMKNRNS